MDFFDKLNDVAKNVGKKAGNIAKNVGDKTNEAIETTKLHAKIRSEECAIAELYRKIGEFYYAKRSEGEVPHPDVEELFYAIDGHKAVIEEAKKQLD